MKKLLLLVLPLMALSFTACNKDDKGGDDTPASKLVKQWIYADEENSYIGYEYDSKDRLIKMSYIEDNVIDDYSTITYGNNTITETFNSNYAKVFTVDDEGYVIKLDYTRDEYALNTIYKYNTYGQLAIEESGNNTINYTWSNGNITQKT